MEQYIHTLIAVDSDFAPQPAHVAGFFEKLLSHHHLRPIVDERHPVTGVAVAKPSGRLRWMRDCLTGEKIASVPHYDRWNIDGPGAIPGFIRDSEHYRVMQLGEWIGKARPLELLKPDGLPYEENYLCTVRCELRPEAVSTSAWDVEAGPNHREVPDFGSACTDKDNVGIFPNPWTGAVIEVPHAGCARFWIEFEFGRFIFPRITGEGLDVIHPALISQAEQCFGTKLAQGCRFL